MPQPDINPAIGSLPGYASKLASLEAKAAVGMVDLSLGEPAFGPPEYIRNAAVESDLTWSSLMDASKRYERSTGMVALRESIAAFYFRRYNLALDPETQILITHGGVEAIALAILSTTEVGRPIGITDPSYMLYSRAANALGRRPVAIGRNAREHEYYDALRKPDSADLPTALIINSPENPTGYVLSDLDWNAVADKVKGGTTWIIHDEVYDTMSFGRPHMPALAQPGLSDRSLLVNSFSKKFGVPGLRIGWLCGRPDIISAASRLHDYLYLGVNILAEKLALRMISHPDADGFLDQTSREMKDRSDRLIEAMSAVPGVSWSRQPHGGMFAFPNVAGLHERLPKQFRAADVAKGAAVVAYLKTACGVATVPGGIYGKTSEDHIRLVLCSTERVFEDGLERLRALRQIDSVAETEQNLRRA